MDLTLPFSRRAIEDIAKVHPTPFHIYDESRLRATCRRLTSAMTAAEVRGFQNYFAVKALPNPEIVKILAEEGMGVDCSSLAELAIAEMCGLSGKQIMFTSNNTTEQEFAYASKLGAIINFDDLSLVDGYIEKFGSPKVASCRFNPGDIEFDSFNESIIGSPREAKFGMPPEDMLEVYRRLKQAGATEFGIHTMLLSNELDWHRHILIAQSVFETAKWIAEQLDIKFSFINLGGGIGVPYNPIDSPFAVEEFASELARLYDDMKLAKLGLPRIVMENGRFITAEAGYLVTRVIGRKQTHKTYVGVDATMSDLMRPGMYGAYHHITALTGQDSAEGEVVDVTGSLCENNDKFAVDRKLPALQAGDILAIHTTGAHGHAMGFQYNGKLRHAELMLQPDASVRLIRRAETLDDYFATLTNKGEYHVPTN